MKTIVFLLSIVIVGCGAKAATPTKTKAEVKEKLVAHMEADPNAELCSAIIAEFTKGNVDALKPYFDTKAFANRVFALGGIPAQLKSTLDAQHDSIPNFYRFLTPPNSNYTCLGTRTFIGEDHLVIRVDQPNNRFDYVMLHMNGKKIDDHYTASGGFYHSELNNVAMTSPEAEMNIVNQFLKLSYSNGFDKVITGYQSLSPALQKEPVVFFHFINAVFEVEPIDGPLYKQAQSMIETEMTGRGVSQQFWRMMDARRRKDDVTYGTNRDLLVAALDDYVLMD